MLHFAPHYFILMHINTLYTPYTSSNDTSKDGYSGLMDLHTTQPVASDGNSRFITVPLHVSNT